MITSETPVKWLRDIEVAGLLRLHPGTLRTWRLLDRREGRGSEDKPGRGGLIWRRFGRAVRYKVTPELLGNPDRRGEAA